MWTNVDNSICTNVDNVKWTNVDTGVMWIKVDNRFLLSCGLTSTVFDVIRNNVDNSLH
jgi:hypothetical protein